MALVATFAVFTILEPRFLDLGNVIEIGVQSSIIGVIALGMTLVIVTHGIDLSVGSIVGLVSVICATNLDAWGTIPTIVVGLALGGLLGMINGSFSALFNLESFVVTLATLNVYRGLAFLYTEGRPIFGIDDGFRDFFGADLGPIPKPILFLLGATVVAYLILNWSRSGTYFKAIGTNELASRKSGVAGRANQDRGFHGLRRVRRSRSTAAHEQDRGSGADLRHRLRAHRHRRSRGRRYEPRGWTRHRSSGPSSVHCSSARSAPV